MTYFRDLDLIVLLPGSGNDSLHILVCTTRQKLLFELPNLHIKTGSYAKLGPVSREAKSVKKTTCHPLIGV